MSVYIKDHKYKVFNICCLYKGSQTQSLLIYVCLYRGSQTQSF